MSRKASKQKEIDCLGSFCCRSRVIPLSRCTTTEWDLRWTARDWLAVHFLPAQNRNAPFPSFYHFIKICAVRVFSRQRILILENRRWEKGWLNGTPKPTEISTRAVCVSFLWDGTRKRGDHALWVKENGAAAIKTAGPGNWVSPKSITQHWQMRKELDGEKQPMPPAHTGCWSWSLALGREVVA